MLKDWKERFLNLDTFIVAPYFIILGIAGIVSIEYFCNVLSYGCLGIGIYYALANRIDRKRKGL